MFMLIWGIEDLRALENNGVHWYKIDWWFYWQYKADKVIMDRVSELAYVDVFMFTWLCTHTIAHIHVHMSGGNHKSAELDNLGPVIEAMSR